MTEKRKLMVNVYPEDIEEYHARIAQLTAERDEWKQDSERLAVDYWETGDDFDVHVCKHCCRSANDFTKIPHAPDCPIALHREQLAAQETISEIQQMALQDKTSSDNNKCIWVEMDDPDIVLWATSCGNEFHIEFDKPSDNHMKYCCYCGKEIREG